MTVLHQAHDLMISWYRECTSERRTRAFIIYAFPVSPAAVIATLLTGCHHKRENLFLGDFDFWSSKMLLFSGIDISAQPEKIPIRYKIGKYVQSKPAMHPVELIWMWQRESDHSFHIFRYSSLSNSQFFQLLAEFDWHVRMQLCFVFNCSFGTWDSSSRLCTFNIFIYGYDSFVSAGIEHPVRGLHFLSFTFSTLRKSFRQKCSVKKRMKVHHVHESWRNK